MKFEITLEINIDGSKQDFIDQIVAQNEGLAIQELAGGKPLNFSTVTLKQKEDFALKILGNNYSVIFNNQQIEAEVEKLRKSLREKNSESQQ